MDLFVWSAQWSWVLCAIAFCSVIATAVFLERLFYLRRANVDSAALLVVLKTSLAQGNIVEAVSHCEESGGAIANIVRAGLLKHQRPRERIESAMEIQGMVEIARLEKNARVLSIIAHLAPLIGLLGTVLGFIQAFSEMRASGLVDISASRIGEAMEYALVTTAAGLVVAIPSVIAYNYLVGRIHRFLLEIQTTSMEVVDLLLDSQSL